MIGVWLFRLRMPAMNAGQSANPVDVTITSAFCPFTRLTTFPIVLSKDVKLSASTIFPPSCLKRDVNAWTTFLK